MTVWFVTGTDTEVGKTVVTAALAAILSGRGRDVAVVKPAQTGVRPGEAGDVNEVRRLTGLADVREGVRLPDALAPDRAALVAGVELPGLSEQAGLVVGAAGERDDVLVEGAGGVTVNLGRGFGLLEIAGRVREAGWPVGWVVVARAGLGTLNHSALTVRAIADRGFGVAGIIIGSWPARPGMAERYNRDHDLAAHAGVPVLGAVPEGAGALTAAEFRALAPGWIAVASHVVAT